MVTNDLVSDCAAGWGGVRRIHQRPRESGDTTDLRDRRAPRRTSYNEDGVRYAREKIGEDVDDDDDDGGGGGDDKESDEEKEEDDEASTDHLLTFLAPASLVRTRSAGQTTATTVRAVCDADSRGRRNDDDDDDDHHDRPRPLQQPRRHGDDAVIRRSASTGYHDDDDDDVVHASGGTSPTVDRGRIVPETTAGNGALPGAPLHAREREFLLWFVYYEL
ncbi:uncharacterized protein DDB_G0283697-like [Monomorium pharaonis]|uniref:uncharacterized protein DDB_G0283697-like n=1 Tax=Monomorium pharaonis TaxID=307658 RepID=UPI0017469565|nr:uncharacterized protein DDB_G0283697-like [Monomorium pharaonis]